jgi:hypothetical protein
MVVYKFVELSVVTEDSLEDTVNEWVGRGWQLDAVRFVVTEHSRRPSMAFVSFIRESDAVAAAEPAPAEPEPPRLGSVATDAIDPASVPQDGAKLPRRAPRPRPPIELGELELPESAPLVEDPET